MKPAKLAEALTAQFLADGNFRVAGAPTIRPTGAMRTEALAEVHNTFATLAVQGVGAADEVAEPGEGEQPEVGVHIYLSKGTRKALKSLPKQIGETPIFVHNVGQIIVRPQAATANLGHIFRRGNRIACGSSCAPSGRNYSGTFGALAQKRGDDTLYAISNNHVFGDCNHLPAGMPIMSPSSADGRHGFPPTMFCEHSEITELRSGVPGLVEPCTEDLAIAQVPDNSIVSSWQGDNDGFDTPTATKNPYPGLKVKKVGRTTGLTHGRIQSRVVRTPVSYISDSFEATVWFRHVWAVRSVDSDPFAVGGDSGSLVVTEDGRHAVGMVFAGNAKGGYVNIIPIDRVLAAFKGLTLVGNHGV